MIEIKNYSKSYSGKKVVDNISFAVNDGEIFGFIGHNGAGKTTTIKSIVGILDFEEGDILINGTSIKKDPMKCKCEIAYVPDNPDIYDNLKGIEYLNFIADIFEMSKELRLNKFKKYADMFGMTKYLGDEIATYSHGMKQKLVMIASLIHDPKVIVLDEPFVGLDPKAVYDLKMVMKELCQNGTTVFFSTHILDVAEKLCDRVAIIKAGEIVKIGSMEEIKGDTSLEEVFLELV